MAINSGFSHKKWWFSIAMLVYQRVVGKTGKFTVATLAESQPLLHRRGSELSSGWTSDSE